MKQSFFNFDNELREANYTTEEYYFVIPNDPGREDMLEFDEADYYEYDM